MKLATEKQIAYFDFLSKKWERTCFGSGRREDNDTRMIIKQIRRMIQENEPIKQILISQIIGMLKEDLGL
jgi:hypothetical protein